MAVLGAAQATAPVYEVRAGDSLSVIALRNGTTVGALKQTNGLRSDVIRTGQKLRLPGTAAGVAAAPAGALKVRPARHLVKPGETLWRIGRRHGVPVGDLLKLNGLRSPQELRAGRWIVVRAGAAQDLPPALPPGLPKTAPSSGGGVRPVAVKKPAVAGSERRRKGRDDQGQAVSFRTVRLDKAVQAGVLAKRHGMTLGQLNVINGWDFAAGTWIGAGSEAFVLNPEVH